MQVEQGNAPSLLVIDDDIELCGMLRSLLEMEQFAVAVRHDVVSGLAEALSGRHRLVVLDIMLPGGDGRALLRDLRTRTAIPVIMLTARGEATDRISGLEDGADDYLAKPFNPGELIARIRAVLRRHAPPAPADIIVVGDITVEVANRRALRDGVSMDLTSAEFDLLVVLLRRAGDCVTRDDLSQQALGRPMGPVDRSIDNHMSNLRRKLGPHADGRERIRNIRSVGYCYTGSSHV
ncbi:response regulator transcription factor [Terriglobus albidus]|uniref:Response regulator transcription factor n=2 Tax=Terriglobus albidus TaxID=1592106 RepID=A0A5B9EM39_9BACT|nr:response regulator transcription factor [Terriglobus albidus]